MSWSKVGLLAGTLGVLFGLWSCGETDVLIKLKAEIAAAQNPPVSLVPQYQLTVTAGTWGTITIPLSSPVTVEEGVPTSIEATPNSGYNFVSWSQTAGAGTAAFGNGSLAATTVTVTGGDVTIQASFQFPQLAMVLIAAHGDTYLMGDDTYNLPNKSEQISYDYNLSKYEITNSEFAKFIADAGYTTVSYWTTNGWSRKQADGYWTEPLFWADTLANGANQPVVGVSWFEAVAYCNWRSAKEGLTPAYNSSGRADLSASGYRLPTEVEWEYAAAKGGPGYPERLYPFGQNIDSWDINKIAWDPFGKSSDVGSKSPVGDTPQGLVDMAGNAYEWCSDNYQADASIEGGVGGGPAAVDRYWFLNDNYDTSFIVRGGSYKTASDEAIYRSSQRYWTSAYTRMKDYGFRVVRR